MNRDNRIRDKSTSRMAFKKLGTKGENLITFNHTCIFQFTTCNFRILTEFYGVIRICIICPHYVLRTNCVLEYDADRSKYVVIVLNKYIICVWTNIKILIYCDSCSWYPWLGHSSHRSRPLFHMVACPPEI
jgi:hypothetical protein